MRTAPRLFPKPKLLRTRTLSSLLLLLAFLLATFSPTMGQEAVEFGKSNPSEILQTQKTVLPGGAELITIKMRWDGLGGANEQRWVPVVSLLRDTLGDGNPENDRLRYLWPLTYTRPTLWQRITGAVPFLYTRVGSKEHSSNQPPPPAIDLGSSDHEVWNRIFWSALQNILLDPYGAPVKASTRSYRRNISDYRKSQIIRALSILSLYKSLDGDSVFSELEMQQIQARLLLTDKTFGGLVDELNLQNYYDRQHVQTRDERGHNWELLRQRAEAESLYFEPLEMPDGNATHALLWVAKPELTTRQNQRYDKRFLNIANPWTDKRLLNWNGYSEVRHFDSEGRPVSADTPGAHGIEMIPLALYGLDHPKIPALLVDFRDSFNPKQREMSRRVLQDVTKSILSLSPFSDVTYLLGRTVFDFVTGKRGMDINQPSRLRTYSQLKLLLALNKSLEPGLRDQISDRLEKVSLNPMENDLEAEAKLADKQYAALIAYATREDGLAVRLQKDRRKEMVKLAHGRTEQVLFQLANILSFGKYVHRESAAPDMDLRLDVARRLTYHTNFLREVSRSGPQVEVKWKLEDIRRSLEFIAEHGSEADGRAVSATAAIFAKTNDGETRRACLEGLTRISNPRAHEELLRLMGDKNLDPGLKDVISSYLSDPTRRTEPQTSSVKGVAGRVEQ